MSRTPGQSPLRRGFFSIALAVCALGGLAERAAEGSAIEYEFTGKIVYSDPGSGIDLLEPITGRLSFDTALGATGVTVPGSQTLYEGPVSLSFTVAGKTYGFTSPAASYIGVQHGSATPDGIGGGDQFLAGVFGGNNTATGLADFLALSLYDPSGRAFTDQSLPTTLDLGKFATGTVGGILDGQTIAAQILTLSPVPEPSSLLVLAAGTLGGLAWIRARTRRNA